MPVRKVNGGYRWGQSGKVYPTKAQAQRQGRAIYAAGYQEGGVTDLSVLKKAAALPEDRSFLEQLRDIQKLQTEAMAIRSAGSRALAEDLAERKPSPAQVAWFLSTLRPGGGAQDMSGLEPGPPGKEAAVGEFRSGESMPGMVSNIMQGKYATAALQGLGGAGDVAYASAPFTGPAGLGIGAILKSASTIGKLTKGAKTADKTADLGIAAVRAEREATATARKAAAKTSKAKRVTSTGQYVGAPRKIKSPQALGRMRSNYIDQVREGLAGKDWYMDSSRWARSVSNSDDEAQRLVDLLALTSQQSNVLTNLGFTVKGLTQQAAGAPIKTGRFPQRQSEDFREILSDSRALLGPKRTPFADNLSMAWNSELASNPVHDIWQGRAMGYENISPQLYPTKQEALAAVTTKKGELTGRVIKDAEGFRTAKPWDTGFSDSQHAFMDREMETIVDVLNEAKMGGKTDWTPAQAQAAAWTGAQIRAGRISPKDAAKHYGSYEGQYAGQATMEQAPGTGTGHLEGFEDLTLAEREAFAKDPLSTWQDPSGRDEIYAAMGIPVGQTVENVGSFRPAAGGGLEINPGEVARPLVQTGPTVGSKMGQLTPESRILLKHGESGRAYIDVQNAGAAHRLIPQGQTAASERTSLNVPLDRKITHDEMVALDDIAINNGMFVVDSGRGVRLINDELSEIGAARKDLSAADLNKERKGTGGLYDRIIAALDEPADTLRVVPAKIDTVYVGYEGLWKQGPGSGAATTKFLDDLDEVPAIRDAAEPVLQRKAAQNLARDEAMAKSSGLAVRADVQEARRILVRSGLAGLRRALNSGAILPAVAAVVVAPAVLLGQPESQQM